MNHEHADWYALRVRRRFEGVVTANLSSNGFEVFLPSYRSRHRRSDQGRGFEVPLFPSYVFCRIHSAESWPGLITPGVLYIVGTGSALTPVDEVEIVSLKTVVRSAFHYEPCGFLNTGPRVRVIDGPLRNLEGILIEPENGCRIVIGVSLLQRSVLVELGEAVPLLPVLGIRSRSAAFLSAM